MPGKTNSFENESLKLILNNTNFFTSIGDSTSLTGSGTPGYLYIALFTGDPAEDQSGVAGNECTYTGYARKGVARSISGFTVVGDTATNAAAITFAACTGGTEIASHFGVCTAGTSGVSDLIYYGQFTGSGLAISSGVTPQIQSGDLSIQED